MTDSDLPAPVRRWLDVDGVDPEVAPSTLVLRGRARLRLGVVPRIPAHVTISHRLGHDRVAQIVVAPLGLPVLRVLDATVDGRSVSQVARTKQAGARVDQGAALALWGEIVILPTTWPALPGLRWEPHSDTAAVVVLPLATGVERAVVSFDPATALPESFSVDRYQGATGEKVPWCGRYGDWRRESGLLLPWRLSVRWAEQPTWFELAVRHVAVDDPVDEALGAARAVIATLPR